MQKTNSGKGKREPPKTANACVGVFIAQDVVKIITPTRERERKGEHGVGAKALVQTACDAQEKKGNAHAFVDLAVFNKTHDTHQ